MKGLVDKQERNMGAFYTSKRTSGCFFDKVFGCSKQCVGIMCRTVNVNALAVMLTGT
jgi:hypothetical protein